MRRMSLIIPVLALAGCAVAPPLPTQMSAYVGGTEAQLVQGLGVPDKQITVKDVSYLAYERRHEQIDPSADFAGPNWGPYYYGGPLFASPFPQEVEVYACEVTFLVKDDHVLGFSLRGNDCQ